MVKPISPISPTLHAALKRKTREVAAEAAAAKKTPAKGRKKK